MKKITILVVLSLVILNFTQITSGEFNSYPEENNTTFRGYIIKVEENQCNITQINTIKLVNILLKYNVTVYWLCSDLNITTEDLKIENSTEVRFFEKGSYIALNTNNYYTDLYIHSWVVYFNNLGYYSTEVYKLIENLSNVKVLKLVEPKIAITNRSGVNKWWYPYWLDLGWFRNIDLLSYDDIIDDKLMDGYNIISMGGQSGSTKDRIIDLFNIKHRLIKKKIQEFVRSGGNYIGSCYGAAIAANGTYHPPGLLYDVQYTPIAANAFKFQFQLIDRKIYRALPGGYGNITGYFKGHNATEGITVRISNRSNPISFGVPEIIKYNEYASGPVFFEKKIGKSNTDTLAVLVDIGEGEHCFDIMMHICPFYKSNLIPQFVKDFKIKKWVEFTIGKPVWVTAKYGDGKVVGFNSHPEFPNTKTPPRILYNAIFYLSSEGPLYVDII